MGLLIEGIWHDRWYDTKTSKGEFVREDSQFRNWITPDGSPGPSGEGGFPAQAGRYHLYVSYACPWAHRTLIFRKLKGLDDIIGLTIVGPTMLEQGWEIDEGQDPIFGAHYLHEVYRHAKPDYSGRVTVPVLFDKERGTIVSNESSEIIRMFNSAFDALTGNDLDFYPEGLREEIDEINARVYRDVNNGVYRAGFATSQDAYERAFDRLFAALDDLESLLARQRYLVSDRITEADWRLFTTILRFDPVYYGHFKTNLRMIEDYPNLSNYLRELYQVPGVAETVNMDHIKRHYYGSQRSINPTGIVPKGPEIDLTRPQDRVKVVSMRRKSA
jgi:putative glutathione S-transferase